MLRSLAAFLLVSGVCAAQSPAPAAAPCQSPEARQFDFWLGEWDLTGRIRVQSGTAAGQWQETRSTNSIRSVQGGCVTQENFENQQPNPWTGMSVSVWSARAGQWQQTWVDSQGGYIPLTGQFADGRMTLTTPERPGPGGAMLVNRMVFHDIARDSLIWDWELSRDGGQTWDLQWSITYRRRK